MNARLEEWDDDDVRNFIDDIYEPIQIGNLTFDASRIVEELDPIAFRCIKSDSMPERWVCEECNEEYETEEDAEDCCRD